MSGEDTNDKPDAHWLDVVDFAYKGVHCLPQPITTGFDILDKITNGGFRPGVHVISARPGTGKTSFGIDMMARQIEQGRKAAIISNEITAEEIFTRFASRMSNGEFGWTDIEHYAKASIDFNDPDHAKAKLALVHFGEIAERYEGRILISGPRSTSDDLWASDTHAVADHIQAAHEAKASLVVIDYLQTIEPLEKCQSQMERVTYVMDSIVSAANKYKIAVLLIASQSRQGMQKDADGLTSTGGSSRVEYAALTMATIAKDKELAVNPNAGERGFKFEVHKNRYGELRSGDDAICARCIPRYGLWTLKNE